MAMQTEVGAMQTGVAMQRWVPCTEMAMQTEVGAVQTKMVDPAQVAWHADRSGAWRADAGQCSKSLQHPSGCRHAPKPHHAHKVGGRACGAAVHDGT
eukprot:359941-Chlamydomonas_euryale.AAC.2